MMTFDDLLREKQRLLPVVASWLVELRAMGTADPRPFLKSVYDGVGPQSVAARVRLGGIESMAALGPDDFGQIVDAAFSRF